ncbi:MAG TPA: bifunctional acetate--CoA ligase family protein/GNAT family N-acetyltransferase [Stellaceae bacterium]|nr:bifunctional acetate--CoA ligase family protein/GNAT family N-acetyltransferase [Stellaceae bacterium]
MSVRNLRKLFRPRSVALIGATLRSGAAGAVALRNLRRGGFKGDLFLVDPHDPALDGLPCHADVASLPAAPDLAVIVTPPETLPGLVAELGERGTKAAVVLSPGFAELDAEGRRLERAALAAAAPWLLRLLGPNGVGLMVPGIGLDASVSPIAPLSGDLAFVSQSGAVIAAVLDWAAPRRIGFSHVIALGGMADVDFGDTLDYLAADPDTRAILLYVEAVTDARKFMSAARAAARSKPVLAVKAGRFAEGARAARSHAGAPIGSFEVYDAAFRRAGMLRVDSMTELFEAVETLALTRTQHGDRLAILTNGGGPGVLAADALLAQGGRLATLSPATIARLDEVLPRRWSRGNPVDLIGDAQGARYAAALSVLLEDQEVDAILVLNAPTALARPSEAARAVIDTWAAAPSSSLFGRNLLTAWLGERVATSARRRLAEARIATYETPDAAVRGFMHRVRHRRNQELLMETPAARPDPFEPDVAAVRAAIEPALAAGPAWLAAEDVVAVLGAYGIPLPASRFAAGPAEAAAAASEIGFPVALKIRSPDIARKSEIGGVVLNLGTPERVRDEAAAMLARIGAAEPAARLEGFHLQAMVQRRGARELIVGLIDDALFGPAVMFGEGGVAVELLRDTTLELPPLNDALARAQMARTRVFRLLQGYRGEPAADLAAIAHVLIRVAQLATDHPEIRELDINPLLAHAEGVVAVDARIQVAPPARPGAARLAISPYPRELESGAELGGTALLLRPVRPEDETSLQDLAQHMNPEDLRLRFFTPMKGLSHALAARLSQIDYDREMALVARRAEDGATLGVARFAADPDNRRAEFAIALRSDWKGRGLGHLLMTRIIDIARRRGIGEIFGDALRENEPMLKLARSLGFALAAHPEDSELVRVTKPLASPVRPLDG